MQFEPRVIGIDDWAWRKGQRYGTLICDLDRRAVIDLRSTANLRPSSRGYVSTRTSKLSRGI